MSDGKTKKEKKLDLLTVAEAAKLVGKCERTIYRWIESGEIEALRIGKVGDYMIPRKEFMESLKYKPKPKPEE